MKDRIIYRGGHHIVVCRDGKHYRRYENRELEPIHGIGATCATWVGEERTLWSEDR